MREIRVGRPYPEPLELRDGMATQPMPGGLHTIVHLSRFEPGDKKAIAGPIRLGVAMLDEVTPWLAVRYEKNGLSLDGPLLVGHRSDLRARLATAGNLLTLVVTEGLRYTVRSIRALGLSDELLEALRSALGQEAHVGRIQERVLAGQRLWPSANDVLEAAAVAQRFAG